MQNLVIVGISDTADRIIRFVERYNLFHVLGCTVNKEYMPKDGIAIVGGANRKVYPLEELEQYIDTCCLSLFCGIASMPIDVSFTKRLRTWGISWQTSFRQWLVSEER